jgi:hypothetical protein
MALKNTSPGIEEEPQQTSRADARVTSCTIHSLRNQGLWTSKAAACTGLRNGLYRSSMSCRFPDFVRTSAARRHSRSVCCLCSPEICPSRTNRGKARWLSLSWPPSQPITSRACLYIFDINFTCCSFSVSLSWSIQTWSTQIAMVLTAVICSFRPCQRDTLICSGC